MYRKRDGASRCVCVWHDTEGIKDLVFVHFNAFKSLMDRDMGWGGLRHKRGIVVWLRWRGGEQRRGKRESQSWGTGEGRVERRRGGEFRKGQKDKKQRNTGNLRTSDLIQRDHGTTRTHTHMHAHFKACFWGWLSFVAVPRRTWILFIITTRYHFKQLSLPPLRSSSCLWLSQSVEKKKKTGAWHSLMTKNILWI